MTDPDADLRQMPMPGDRARKRRTCALFAAIVCLAAIVRGVYLWQYARTGFGGVAVGADVNEYDAWARRILGGEVLWRDVNIHAPLYPYVLAFLRLVCRQSIPLVRGLQLAGDMLSMALVATALLLRRKRRTALIASLLWAVHLPIVFYSAELVSEGLVVLCLCAFLLLHTLAAKARERCASRHLLGFSLPAGLALGLAAVTHPLSLAMASAVAIAEAAGLRHEADWRVPAAAVCLLAVGIAVPIVPVALRNHAVSGEWMPIQAHGGLNFYIGNNPGATGTCYVRPGADYEALVRQAEAHGATSDRGADSYYYGESGHFIRRHPLRWLGLLGRKLLLTWNTNEIPSGTDLPEIQKATPIMRAPLLRFGLLGPLGLVGIFVCRRRKDCRVFLLWAGAYSAGLALFVTSGRYRVAMLPALFVLAAQALEHIRDVLLTADRRRRVATAGLLALAALVVWLPRSPALPGAEEETALAAAEALYRRRDAGGAESAARELIRRDPAHGPAHRLLGILLADRGKHEEAIRHYTKAMELDPGDDATPVNVAVSLSELGRGDEAREALERLVKTQPDNAGAWYNLGILAQKGGDTDTAARRYREALTHDPGLASAHLNLGLLVLNAGRPEDALPSLKTAVRLTPEKVNALNALAVAYAETGQRSRARRMLDRSLSLAPDQPDLKRMIREYFPEQR